MKTATQWLAGKQDYTEGVELFKTLSNNRNLGRYLSRPENKTRKEKLVYELEKIAQTEGAIEAPPAKRENNPTATPQTNPSKNPKPAPTPTSSAPTYDGVEKHAKSMLPKVDFAKLDDDLKSMYARTVEKQHQRRKLHDSLFEKTKSAERAIVAKQIDELTDEINENWYVLLTFETTGKKPEPKPVAQPQSFNDLSPVERQKKLINERTSKSKAKKRVEQYNKDLKKTKDPKAKKKIEAKIKRTEKTLAEKTANVELLEKLVNG